MDTSVYVLIWIMYLSGAVGLTLVFWRMTRNMKIRRTRRSLRALVAAIFFTPINIGNESLWLAPAYLVGAYDFILGEYQRASQAGLFLSAVFLLLILMVLLESVLRRLFEMETGK